MRSREERKAEFERREIDRKATYARRMEAIRAKGAEKEAAIKARMPAPAEPLTDEQREVQARAQLTASGNTDIWGDGLAGEGSSIFLVPLAVSQLRRDQKARKDLKDIVQRRAASHPEA